MRSLTTRWTLALVAVCLVEAVLVVAAVRIGTQRSFDRFVEEQAMTGFSEAAARYYRATGTLDGIDTLFRPDGRPGPPPAESGPVGRRSVEPEDSVRERPTPERRGNGERRARAERRRSDRRPLRFGLADASGRIVLSAGTYQLGDSLQDGEGTQRYPLIVDGETVGTILRTAEAQALGPGERRFLEETQAALWWAVALALLVALGLGFVLARATTRPIRALTEATEAMARGELDQTVPVTSDDEIGHLATSFNTMTVKLAEARQLRRQMTADIAHDLRTPLSVLTGYLEAIREGALEASPERIATMHAEAELLGRLIEDLRTLALADAGELTLHPTTVAPGSLLARVVAAFTPEAKAAGLALGLDVASDLPTLQVDVDRLNQVLGNLIRNAIRHTPAGGVISLSAQAHPDGVHLTVTDSGEGIDPTVLPHIFERTVRGDSARSQDGGASGLGLAIARSLMEAQGGTITVESRPGEGATFTVTLPGEPPARVENDDTVPEKT